MREKFIQFLKNNEIHYSEYTCNGLDAVYVFSRKEYEEVMKHPRKNKDMYVPQVRVSHFNEDRLYVKDNGWIRHMTYSDVIDLVLRDYA